MHRHEWHPAPCPPPNNCEDAAITPAPHGSDGSISLTGSNAYVIEDLPNGALGTPNMVGKCDVAPNQCVLGIFSESPAVGGGNPAAFTTPHLFTGAFAGDSVT